MFYLILNIDRSDLRMFACFSYLGVPTVASSKKQMLKNKKKRTETGHFFAFFSCPVVGRDTFSPLVQQSQRPGTADFFNGELPF